jgi:aminoglycoside 6'-N-acetyltransferase I
LVGSAAYLATTGGYGSYIRWWCAPTFGIWSLAALVSDLEDRARARGALTLWLGTDDVTDMTTLSGVDLYPDVLGHLANTQNLRGHPYGFYSKLGFSLIGAMPEANGWGKPDIYMAKRCR